MILNEHGIYLCCMLNYYKGHIQNDYYVVQYEKHYILTVELSTKIFVDSCTRTSYVPYIYFATY